MTTQSQNRRNRPPSLESISRIGETTDTPDINEAIIPSGDPDQPGQAELERAIAGSDIDTLRRALRSRGLEVRLPRTNHSGTMSKANDVKGKSKVTVYLPTKMRDALEDARHATRTKTSHLVEEAVGEWLQNRGLRST